MYHCYMEISHSAEDVHDGHLLRDHEVSEPGQSVNQASQISLLSAFSTLSYGVLVYVLVYKLAHHSLRWKTLLNCILPRKFWEMN